MAKLTYEEAKRTAEEIVARDVDNLRVFLVTDIAAALLRAFYDGAEHGMETYIRVAREVRDGSRGSAVPETAARLVEEATASTTEEAIGEDARHS